MDEYTPQAGDRVRRIASDGTIFEGEISFVAGGGSYAESKNGYLLYDSVRKEQTELLHRPVEFKKEVGTCYRHPDIASGAVVKVDYPYPNNLTWVGYVPGVEHAAWFFDYHIEDLVKYEGWIEHDLQKVEES